MMHVVLESKQLEIDLAKKVEQECKKILPNILHKKITEDILSKIIDNNVEYEKTKINQYTKDALGKMISNILGDTVNREVKNYLKNVEFSELIDKRINNALSVLKIDDRINKLIKENIKLIMGK